MVLHKGSLYGSITGNFGIVKVKWGIFSEFWGNLGKFDGIFVNLGGFCGDFDLIVDK